IHRPRRATSIVWRTTPLPPHVPEGAPMRWLIVPVIAALLAGPARAADPVRHAGIEIGGSGVKVTVVDVRPDGLINRVFSKSHKTTLTTLDDGRFKDA